MYQKIYVASQWMTTTMIKPNRNAPCHPSTSTKSVIQWLNFTPTHKLQFSQLLGQQQLVLKNYKLLTKLCPASDNGSTLSNCKCIDKFCHPNIPSILQLLLLVLLHYLSKEIIINNTWLSKFHLSILILHHKSWRPQ